MKLTVNNKVLFLSILFGGFCTSLFSQTNEKVEKVKPKKILNLTSYIESNSTFIESKSYSKLYCPGKPATIVEGMSFNVMRRGEVSRLASRNLYDMVIILR